MGGNLIFSPLFSMSASRRSLLTFHSFPPSLSLVQFGLPQSSLVIIFTSCRGLSQCPIQIPSTYHSAIQPCSRTAPRWSTSHFTPCHRKLKQPLARILRKLIPSHSEREGERERTSNYQFIGVVYLKRARRAMKCIHTNFLRAKRRTYWVTIHAREAIGFWPKTRRKLRGHAF